MRHGLLSEIRDELEAGPSRSYRAHSDSASEAIANESYEDTDSESQNLLVHTRTVSIRDALSSQGKDAAKFLQRMDKDIHKIIESTKSRMDTLEEVTKSLTCRRIYPLQQRRSLFSGVDCGIRWWSLLIIVGVVAVIMPTLYVVYSKLVKPPSWWMQQIPPPRESGHVTVQLPATHDPMRPGDAVWRHQRHRLF